MGPRTLGCQIFNDHIENGVQQVIRFVSAGGEPTTSGENTFASEGLLAPANFSRTKAAFPRRRVLDLS